MKIVRNHSDLAINGAAPAFDQPLHVGRPSIGDRARFFALMDEILDRRWLSNNGPIVQRFEAAVAEYLGVAHCVTVCNGTIALEVAIRALELEGEVIVPSYTFIATAHALRWLGLTPIFADIDPATHNLDPESVRRLITPRTSGIIGVHLWGRAAPVGPLIRVAKEHGLKLFFDAAHAFGCSHGNRMIGGSGECEILSFHATKFFNTFEGGAVVTNDGVLADKIRRMCNFGFAGLDDVQGDGTNGKMTEPVAAMGLVNLEQIDRVIAINRRNYHAYRAGLSGLPGLSLNDFDDSERNNYQYVVVEVGPEFGVGRDAILAALRAENVFAWRYFWPGCHRMMPYRDLYPDAGCHLPETERIAERVIVLPTGPAVNLEGIDVICSIIRAVALAGERS